MEKNSISIHSELLFLIKEVKRSKDSQEIELIESFKELANSLRPVEVVKSSFHELVNDKEVQFDLVKGGMKLGANYIIESAFNKQSGIKGFLSSMFLEKISSTFIQANAGSIISGVTSVFFNKKEKTE